MLQVKIADLNIQKKKYFFHYLYQIGQILLEKNDINMH